MNDAVGVFIRAGTLDELRDRRRMVFSTPGGAVLIAAEGDDVVALDNRCPTWASRSTAAASRTASSPATGTMPVLICGAVRPSISGRTTCRYEPSASLTAKYG